VPSNLSIEEQQNAALADSSDESPAVRCQGAGIEAAALPEGSQVMAREQSGGHPGQRRNTGGRRHSPSTAAADQAALGNIMSKRPEESMQQLTEKFEVIRRDTEEIMGLVSKDAEEFKSQMLELMREKDEKRQALKEKEEASEKLKKEVHNSERANRQAQNRKTQKEKVIRDKQAERTKMHDDIARWRKEIVAMKAEREDWQKEKENLGKAKEAQAEELREMIRKRQNSLNGLEEEIRIKGLQIKELEEERKNLPGAEDNEESRERDATEKQRDLEWDIKERDLITQLNEQSQRLRQLIADLRMAQSTLNALSMRQANNPLMYQQANSSGVDFDPTGGQKAKPRRSRNRKSRTNTISSPVAGYPIVDSPFPSASAYNNLNNTTSPSFAPGPYFDLSNDTAMVPLSEQMSCLSEAEVRAFTAGAPLSPSATSLLPSNIFADDPPSPRADSTSSFGPAQYSNIGPSGYENDPQSPESSSRSASLMSSPQTSSHNLAMYGVSGHDYGVENDRRSLNSPRADFGAIGSPNRADQSKTQKGFGNIFTFPRTRGKTMQDGGPALGSLKQGQSQSFPRSTEEPESIANRYRRISFSSGWNVMPSFLRGSTTTEATEGNAPAPARSNMGARRRRGFNMFGSSIDDPTAIYSDRDPSSPRPVSIASSDLPRPSTDSAPFGWPATEGILINRNSPLATNWSVNVPQTWSRNPSRRPSIQHGSTTALATGIASDDDEFLPSDTLAGQSSPPPVGVIGTRPPSSHNPVTPKLNPAAPTFKAMFSRTSRPDKGKSKEKVTDKSASLEESPIGTSTSINTPAHTAATSSSSPSESRKSRDTPSIHTQNSVAESHESLERTSSNTPSDMNTQSSASGKEKESSFRQLLRKGSSSKFSFSSIRGKDSGLFGGKKGGSVATNSDRNASAERDGSFDEYGEDAGLGRSVDSVTSSPMIGSLGSGEWKGKERDTGTPKEGRMSVNWGRVFKKGKGRESLDVDRSEAETTGTEDEGEKA
jgi:hypothetical protein